VTQGSSLLRVFGRTGSPMRLSGPFSPGMATKETTDVRTTHVDRKVEVAVLETNPSGHRLHYVKYLVDAVGSESSVVLTSARATGSEEYAVQLSSAADITVALPEVDSPRAALAAAVSKSLALGARTLIVPDGDRYLIPLCRLLLRHPRLSLEIRLLLMRTTTISGPERPRPATLVKPLLAQLVRKSTQARIMFLTDAFGVVRTRPGYRGIPAVRDPVVPDTETARDRPAWLPRSKPGSPLVGVFGVITPRKNLPLLVKALDLCPSAVLVVGGALEMGMREYVDTDEDVRRHVASGRMVIVDRLLSADEFAAGLAKVDLVAVLYDNDAPSGILAEACMRHTPVLVPTGGWLARVAQSTGVGATTPLTAEGVAQAIQRVTGDRQRYVEATRVHAPRLNIVDFVEHLLGRRH
jgi:glycosyltransferase involved in cell wall biosynthesis